MTKLLASLVPPFLFSLISMQLSGQELRASHKDSLVSVVEQYYALNLKVFQTGSTPADVDNIFKLFTDDFTYNHPKYGGEYSRVDLYNGYIRNQKNGAYNSKIIDIKIVNRIVGLNALVIQKRFVEKTENGIVEGDQEMTLFEFRNGKIFRIFEYW